MFMPLFVITFSPKTAPLYDKWFDLQTKCWVNIVDIQKNLAQVLHQLSNYFIKMATLEYRTGKQINVD